MKKNLLTVGKSGRMLATSCLILSVLAGCSGKSRDELYAEGMKHAASDPGGSVVFFKKALEKDQNFVDARFELAAVYVKTHKLEQAEKELQKVLLQQPAHPQARLKLAGICNALKKPDRTIELLAEDTASAADRKLDLLGVAYSQKKMHAEARSSFLKALQANPGNRTARLHLAAEYQAAGDLKGARGLLEELVAGHPEDVDPLFALASLEKKEGKPEKALELYGRFPDNVPGKPLALYEKGILQIQMNQLQKGEETAAELQRKFPGRAEGMKLRGVTLLQRRKYAEAVTEFQNAMKARPSLDGYYYLGLALFGKGELETALSHFRRVVDVEPDFRQARIFIALTLLKQKRHDDAVSELKKLVEKNPRDAAARNLLGTAFMEKRMFDEGMRELNLAAELDPSLVEPHLKKGMYRMASGGEREAERDFLAALRASPELLGSRLMLAQYYARMQNPAKALSTLKGGLKGVREDAVLYQAIAGLASSQKKEKEALDALERAKQADPSFPDPYFVLAAYYISRGDAAKAQKEYDDLLRVNPGNLRGLLASAALQEMNGNEKGARDFYERAVAGRETGGITAMAGFEMRRQNPSRALSVLNEAIKAAPRNGELLSMKGSIQSAGKSYSDALDTFSILEEVSPEEGIRRKAATYVAMGKGSKAEAEARRLISLKPRSAAGYILLAAVKESGKDTASAIEELKKGLAAEPGSVQASMVLGELYAKGKDLKSAMSAFETAARANPAFSPAVTAQAKILEGSGKTAEAVKKYREALGRNQSDAEAMNNLAYLYADQKGMAGDSLRLAAGAYRLAPGDPSVLDTLGYALIRNGRSDLAVKPLEKASSLLPANQTVTYHLAMAYAGAGKTQQASAKLRECIGAGIFTEIAQAKDLLASLNKR